MKPLRSYTVTYADAVTGEIQHKLMTTLVATHFDLMNDNSRLSLFYVDDEIVAIFNDTYAIVCNDQFRRSPTDETKDELDHVLAVTNAQP